MKSHPRIFLWLIIALTLLAIVIVGQWNIPLNFDSPKLPFINKKISLHTTFTGLQFNYVSNGQLFQKIFTFHKGLDLEGGTSVTLRADMSKVPVAQRKGALEGVKTVLERRINLYGVSEPIVQTATVNGDSRIIVDLPGVNVNQALSLIGTTAQLSFWENGASGSGKLRDPQLLPIGMTQVIGVDALQTNLTGNDLKSTSVIFDPNNGNPEVQLEFTAKGAKKFADITSRNVGKIVAIVLDNQVIEAPVVQQAIVTGSAVINGSFTSASANQLSIELEAGQLPVPLTVLQQQSIGATLGQTSLEQSLFAGAIGFLVVVFFMTILYGRFGLVASVALILYTLFVLAVFKIIPVTLTLAGIAGFILSIGMAVDANILIFERTKEELRSGKPQRNAIELGFARAWSSIRDSNISTLITSLILYKFGTGIVKGFALTLAIGVIISMFSAIVVTRTFLRVFLEKK